MISSIHADARYLAETNKDRFSSFVMRRSNLVGLTINTSLTFSIAGDSTALSRSCGRLHTVPCVRNLLTRCVTCLRFTLSEFGNFFAKFINNNLTFPLDFKILPQWKRVEVLWKSFFIFDVMYLVQNWTNRAKKIAMYFSMSTESHGEFGRWIKSVFYTAQRLTFGTF